MDMIHLSLNYDQLSSFGGKSLPIRTETTNTVINLDKSHICLFKLLGLMDCFKPAGLHRLIETFKS